MIYICIYVYSFSLTTILATSHKFLYMHFYFCLVKYFLISFFCLLLDLLVIYKCVTSFSHIWGFFQISLFGQFLI